MFKWLRRDRRLALIVIVDVLLVVVVVVALALLLWPSTVDAPGAGAPLTSVGSSPALGTTGLELATPSPLPPTVNPTRLAALPNQGQSDAPPLPPGVAVQGTVPPGGNQLPGPTPSPSLR
jgi:hypothetical protein